MLLLTGIAAAGRFVSFLENQIYQNEIVLARNTKYQRVIVTRWRSDIRLYLDGHLQFSTVDEHRYHESLIQPAMHLAERPRRVLILGGGDGLAAREVLKHADVDRIDLVDIDPVVTGLFRDHPLLSQVNGGSMRDSRVRIYNVDALRYLNESDQFYDVIAMDLPDPSTPELSKLYSRGFFQLATRRLAKGGVLATQATSPFRSREAFWCIIHTIQSIRWGPPPEKPLHVYPYHTVVPTFGTWGFVLAGRERLNTASIKLKVPTKYLSDDLLPTLFVFAPDMNEVETPINSLNDPATFRLYSKGYHRFLD